MPPREAVAGTGTKLSSNKGGKGKKGRANTIFFFFKYGILGS